MLEAINKLDNRLVHGIPEEWSEQQVIELFNYWEDQFDMWSNLVNDDSSVGKKSDVMKFAKKMNRLVKMIQSSQHNIFED